MTVTTLMCLTVAVEASAQSAAVPSGAATPAALGGTTSSESAASTEPPLRRWLEFQTITLHARYRFLDSNRTGASHDPQYKEAIRARLNLDNRKRYSVNVGFFSGTQFIGTFDNMGLGLNEGDYHSHYVKQLFLSATPVTGIEFQYGGIYVTRGESTEITTYDDDGYIAGERIAVRRPRVLFVDEMSITRGLLGPAGLPNLFDRWYGMTQPNYLQVLAVKRVTSTLAASMDYTSVAGADTLHGAVVLRFAPAAPLTSLRYEQYYRHTRPAAAGFAVTAEPPAMKRIRLSGGYTTVDEHYDANANRAKLNSERMQRGRRFFVTANVPLSGALSAVVFFTRALPATYELTNRTRVDAMVQYDLLSVLRRSGKL